MRHVITEHIREAVTNLAVARRDMQATMRDLSALETLVMLPLLERCTNLATDLEALRGAMLQDRTD